LDAPVSDLRRVETRFVSAWGRKLFRRAWLPDAPTAVLVVVHGFGEHSGRYEEVGRTFAHRGFAVHAYDHVGHGQSTGRRGHVATFDWFLDDLEHFIRIVREEHPGLPLVLLGHSMGGLIVASLAGQRTPAVDLLVTSGAALAVGEGVSGFRMAMARVLRRVWPTLTLEAGLDVQGLSRDPEVIRAYEADPLVHGKASAAFGAGMAEATERAQAGAPQVTRPMLLLHGEDDPLCKAEGSRLFFEALPREHVKGSELRIYPGLRHEIFNEPERGEVFADMLTWIEARLVDRAAMPRRAAGRGGTSA